MRSLLIALSLVLASGALAQEPPGEVRLPLERYDRLMKQLASGDGPAVTWSRGTGSVGAPAEGDPFVRVSIDARVQKGGRGAAEVPLLPADVVLEYASVAGSDAALLRRGAAHVALLPDGTDSASISLTYLVPVRASASGGLIALIPLPPAPGMTLTIAGAGGVPEVWPGGATTPSGDGVQVSLPATVAAAVRWPGAGGGDGVQRIAYSLLVAENGDAVDLSAEVDAWLAGAAGEVRLAPATMALVSVKEGAATVPTRVRDGWHVAILQGKGRHTLAATWRMGVDRTQGQPAVHLTLDEVPITQVTTTVRGKREVTLLPEVPVSTDVRGEGDDAITTARAHLPPTTSITVRWTEARPAPEQLERINAETIQLVTIQEGVVRSKVHIRYEVLRGKVKELPVQIPEDAVLYKVTGDSIEDWRTFAKTDDAPRQVRIMLGREQEGAYALELELEAVIAKGEGSAVDVPVVRPLGVFREVGVVALLESDKVGFGPGEQTQYTKVGEDALPADIRQGLTSKVSQAFKHIGPPGPIGSTVATAKARDVRFDARVLTLYAVKDGSIVANAQVQVEVKSGRQDVVMLSFPEAVTVLGVTAPSLNKAEAAKDVDAGAGRKAHEVRFTQALEGAIQLDVEFEVLLPKQLGKVALPDVRVLNAEIEQGSFGVSAETGIEVQPVSAGDLRRVDVTELPKAVRLRAVQELLMGWQYAHTPWNLELEIKRHETVETLKAAVNQGWLETTVLQDGHIVTRLVYVVVNDDRQFLRLELPDGAKVWTVTADGSPVKAVSDEKGALAVPLPKGRTVPVEVTYEMRRDPLGLLSSADLMAPKADMLITNLQWLVRWPAHLALLRVDTKLDEGAIESAVRPGSYGGGQVVPIALPSVEDTVERLFVLPVLDPSEAAPAIAMTFAVTPGRAVNAVLGLLALGLLGFAVWRRATGSPGKLGWIAGGVGVLLALLKLALFDVVPEELAILFVALLLLGVVGWTRRGREGRS